MKTFLCFFSIVFYLSVVNACNYYLDLFNDGLISDLCPLFSKITATINDLISPEDDSPVSSALMRESLKCGRELSKTLDRKSEKLVSSGVDLEPYPQGIKTFFQAPLAPDVDKAARVSREIISATKLMEMKLCTGSNVTPNTFLSFLEHHVIKIRDTSFCTPYSKSCRSSSKYRTLDGTCNNVKHPGWGRRNAPFTRIAKARYADGIEAMPEAISGRPLPNARYLSTRLFPSRNVQSVVLTHLNMQWGQLITHDMAGRIMLSTDEGGIQCCQGNGAGVLPSSAKSDYCIPILVPENDPFYSYHGVKCLNFVRSVTAPRDDCSLGHAEQLNGVTSYLDGSLVYGSGQSPDRIRSYTGGRLKCHKNSRGKCFLPLNENKNGCDLRNMSDTCYYAGDVRINQTPTLAVLQTLLLREHNRVADVLKNLNPLWSDDKLFNEARKIVVAEIQHITYQEWLPLNLGDNYMRYYRISPNSLFSYDYNPDVNPGTINSFATAAFRFLHSMIPDHFMACPMGSSTGYLYRLSDYYANPSILEQSNTSFDDLIRGLVTLSSSESDQYVSSEITNYLFKSTNKWGLDLIAMDIQRGRDHGIASYNEFRETCGLRRAKTFQDLADEIPQDRINTLQQIYESVDDIDLYVGGSLEQSIPGSVLGHTFQCIVAEQFYRTRIGDRFFYDNGEMEHSFTADQLREIKKSSMARLICDNSDAVYNIQRKAFELESPYNLKYRCDDYQAIPHVDLSAWKKNIYDIFD